MVISMSWPSAFHSCHVTAGQPGDADLLRLIRDADVEEVPALVAGIPEPTRARFAAYLYGRSHTHRLGLTIAQTCTEQMLIRVAGTVGEVMFRQSQSDYSEPTYGSFKVPSPKTISLGGVRRSGHGFTSGSRAA
jgi:hypothetical protein